MSDSKPWWLSKILAVNVFAAGFVALEANLNLVQPYLPVNVYATLAVSLAVINALLRVITSQKLTL